LYNDDDDDDDDDNLFNFSYYSMMESKIQSVVDEIRQKLQPLVSHIKKQTSMGASILYKRLTT
jgi:hypothetical protein